MAFGVEFQVNTYTTNVQSHQEITTLSDGSFVVTWMSKGQDSVQDGDIYAQLYSNDGTPTGAEFLVNTYTTNWQDYPSISALSNGGFVVTWQSYQDGSVYGIYGQMFNGDGSINGSEFQVNSYTYYYQRSPSVTGLGNGGFVVTWTSDGQDGDGLGIYGQMYNSNGSVDGVEFQINTTTASYQGLPDVTSLSNGGFLVSWTSDAQDGDSYGIYGQLFTANGAVSGGEFLINSYTANQQTGSSATALSGGGFVVTWDSTVQDSSGAGVFGQIYAPNGTVLGTEFQINTYTLNFQSRPSVTALDTGGFVVTWQSDGQDSSGPGVYGQLFNANGTADGGEFQINTHTTNAQGAPSVTALSDGGFVVSWQSQGQDGDNGGIFARIFYGEIPCNELIGTSAADTINGTTAPDCIFGEGGSDLIYAYGDDDLIWGGGGHDTIYAGSGDDEMVGQNGRDVIFGGHGSDDIYGGEGRDKLHGGAGRDFIHGDGGNDRLWGDAGNDVLDGGAGRDRLFGGGGADVIEGGTGNDKLKGGNGADTFVFKAGHGNDIIKDFQDGIDIISFFSGATSMGDLTITQNGADVTVGYGAELITIKTELVANIDSNDFEF